MPETYSPLWTSALPCLIQTRSHEWLSSVPWVPAERHKSATLMDPAMSRGVHGYMMLCAGETQPSVVPVPMPGAWAGRAGGRAGGLGRQVGRRGGRMRGPPLGCTQRMLMG